MERSDHSSNTDDGGLLDEAYLALGTAALYCKDTDTALHNYSLVNNAQGAYKQCEVKIMSYVMLLCVLKLMHIHCYYYYFSLQLRS